MKLPEILVIMGLIRHCTRVDSTSCLILSTDKHARMRPVLYNADEGESAFADDPREHILPRVGVKVFHRPSTAPCQSCPFRDLVSRSVTIYIDLYKLRLGVSIRD